MNKESKPSLFLPLLVAVLFLFVVLSGITEVACLASYANKTNQRYKLTNKTQLPTETSASKVLSSVSVVEDVSK